MRVKYDLPPITVIGDEILLNRYNDYCFLLRTRFIGLPNSAKSNVYNIVIKFHNYYCLRAINALISDLYIPFPEELVNKMEYCGGYVENSNNTRYVMLGIIYELIIDYIDVYEDIHDGYIPPNHNYYSGGASSYSVLGNSSATVSEAKVQPTARGSIEGGKYGCTRIGRQDPQCVGCDPYTRFHGGIDFTSPVGNPLASAYDGVVYARGYSRGLGTYIIVRSQLENGNNLYLLYAHLSTVSASNGSTVNAGDKIGESGISGNASQSGASPPHVHIEARTGSPGTSWGNLTRVNPSNYIPYLN